jgi:hypothetical protein
METEPTEKSPYLPPTAPEWAQYYRRAKELRRFGRGQYHNIRGEIARRRRQANVMIIISTAALVAIFALCYSVLGLSTGLEPEGQAARTASHTV